MEPATFKSRCHDLIRWATAGQHSATCFNLTIYEYGRFERTKPNTDNTANSFLTGITRKVRNIICMPLRQSVTTLPVKGTEVLVQLHVFS